MNILKTKHFIKYVYSVDTIRGEEYTVLILT